MSCKCNHSRRQFLRTASMASMAGFYVSPFFLELNSLAAMAQGTGASDYRALVCVYLQGGNDGHGTSSPPILIRLPLSPRHAPARPALRTRWPICSPLPSRLHKVDAPLRSILRCSACKIFSARAAPPLWPIPARWWRLPPKPKSTRTRCSSPIRSSRTSIKPPHGRPFPPTSAAANTWVGGAVADAIEAMNMNSNSMFTCISTAGNALFLAGQTSFQLNVTPAGPIPIYGVAQPPFGLSASADPLNFHPHCR